jgi:hypothetical protein
MKKRKPGQALAVLQTRQELNRLMEAVAFVMAQRQMKRRRATGPRATLPSIIELGSKVIPS